MNITDNKAKTLEYATQGICCKTMQIKLHDNVIQDVEFIGGCDGNLKGLKVLLKNMHIDEVIEKFSGITCGGKTTSCPDQLAKFLVQYKSKL